MPRRGIRLAARALLDDRARASRREGHSRGLDHLQVDGREQPRPARIARVRRPCSPSSSSSVPSTGPDAARDALPPASAVSVSARIVGEGRRQVRRPRPRADRDDARAAGGGIPRPAGQRAGCAVGGRRRRRRAASVSSWCLLDVVRARWCRSMFGGCRPAAVEDAGALFLERGAAFGGILRREADRLQIALVLDGLVLRHGEGGLQVGLRRLGGDRRARGDRRGELLARARSGRPARRLR